MGKREKMVFFTFCAIPGIRPHCLCIHYHSLVIAVCAKLIFIPLLFSPFIHAPALVSNIAHRPQLKLVLQTLAYLYKKNDKSTNTWEHDTTLSAALELTSVDA